MLYLDTHAVLWLYEGRLELFTKKGLQLIEKNELLVSPMTMLEIQYLHEIKRCTIEAEEIMSTLQQQIDMSVCTFAFNEVAKKAFKIHWTRDPFDRLIIANAMVNHSQLLTKDIHIKKHFKHAIW